MLRAILTFVGLLTLASLVGPPPAGQQSASPATETPPFCSGNCPIAEVEFTFHASDVLGLPVTDLKHGEITVLDNGLPQAMLLSFYVYENRQVRAGILADASDSSKQRPPANHEIAMQFVKQIFRQKKDLAFVVNFGDQLPLTRAWTTDPEDLVANINKVTTSRQNKSTGDRAIFDHIDQACSEQFGKINYTSSANLILLLSTGRDSGSHTSLREAVKACQRTDTAIYAFRSEAETDFTSAGSKTLSQLATETGGHFFEDNSPAGISKSLQTVEQELRDQYRVVYHPNNLKRDGSFHRIELKMPKRVHNITLRSGYYAETN